MSKRNERLREDVYGYLSDDEFYKSFKKHETTAKNKYIKQRLKEIENKKWREANPELLQKHDQLAMGCLIVVGIIGFMVFLFIK